MSTKKSVLCDYCRSSFLKDIRRINENMKLGHKSYCSPGCQHLAKNKQIKLICENSNCRRRFRRDQSRLSFRNYCSQKCYGVAVGIRNKAVIKKFHYCKHCGKKLLKNIQFCSPQCWGLAHRISKKELIKKVTTLAIKLSRPPTRRECSFSTSCCRYYGSWNNTLLAANLIPHRSLNQKMYKRTICKARDGHVCSSISELIIDNWLFKHSISHTKEAPYPEGKFTADWKIGSNTFVEYFGLANDSKRYDEDTQKKQLICKKHDIRLIAIYAKDLYPIQHINAILNNLAAEGKEC